MAKVYVDSPTDGHFRLAAKGPRDQAWLFSQSLAAKALKSGLKPSGDPMVWAATYGGQPRFCVVIEPSADHIKTAKLPARFMAPAGAPDIVNPRKEASA